MLLLEIAAQLQQKQIKNNADKIDDVTPFSSSSSSFTCFCITKPLQLQQQQQKISWVFRLKHWCHLRMRFSPPLPSPPHKGARLLRKLSIDVSQY